MLAFLYQLPLLIYLSSVSQSTENAISWCAAAGRGCLEGTSSTFAPSFFFLLMFISLASTFSSNPPLNSPQSRKPTWSFASEREEFFFRFAAGVTTCWSFNLPLHPNTHTHAHPFSHFLSVFQIVCCNSVGTLREKLPQSAVRSIPTILNFVPVIVWLLLWSAKLLQEKVFLSPLCSLFLIHQQSKHIFHPSVKLSPLFIQTCWVCCVEQNYTRLLFKFFQSFCLFCYKYCSSVK